ncbi:hypothetical protein [Stackebrandtia nassauensis]|uniref:Uncharacterized protein n=1 Tax=Stackebrandtia nassauensis (strain DSM 44728 / CIP 108903 / NRRL B-16338 / NBRC 102104 / LLR-40K-21) TaxID=446470 RepID=D3Q1P8_STANL|nr:hypothetical protein [Stackebrandtia nassauensis]ADD39896.1 hypothetical protein Snas_0176 [Stackebrandtia nassauensis DSM 44728]
MENTNKTHSGQTTSFLSRLTSFGREIFAPVTAPPKSPQRSLLVARQATALLGIFGTVVQVIVWLMIGVIGGDLDAPWWLWTVAASTLLVAGFTMAHRLIPGTPRPDTAANQPNVSA